MVTGIRLLRRTSEGEYTFEVFPKGREPRYAILSHTWDAGEVSFDDVVNERARQQGGWKKIVFCADRASVDGLQYFWVDTCCIDKRNLTELQAAINSMWRWYEKSSKCYVYLPDVSADSAQWQSELRNSRWFTRGWTLQELVAPRVVEFFSQEGSQVGDKTSLQNLLHTRTSIPLKALLNGDMSAFTVEERLSWLGERETTIEEDMAYCMLGILGVSLLVNYGEGKEEAESRLYEKVQKQKALDTDSQKFIIPVNFADMPAAKRFVDRPEMKQLEEALLSQRAPDAYAEQERRVYVLRGLGGIGKMQLARKFAERHRNEYSAILWIDGSDKDPVKRSLARAAADIFQPLTLKMNSRYTQSEVGNASTLVPSLLDWPAFSGNTRWLMVFDNVDREYDPKRMDPLAYDLKTYLPRTDHGTILITTRLAQLGQLGVTQEVTKVNRSTALAILQRWHNVKPGEYDLRDVIMVRYSLRYSRNRSAR